MSPQLLVADINRSIGFYTRELGFKMSFRYEDFYAGITKDGYSIHLKLAGTVAEERKNRRDNEHLDIVFSVEDIGDFYQNIKNSIPEIIQPLREMPYGLEFYIADPDGYIIGFLEETPG